MIINKQNINIDDLFDEKYMHKEVKKGIFLNDYQLIVLKKYKIDLDLCNSNNDILFFINEILDTDEDDDLEDLEAVALEISEFNYYSNTNK